MEFSVETQGQDIMSALDTQRQESRFSDVVLKVNDDAIPAHRCVLSAASDYFRTLFLSGFQDNTAEEYTMPPGSTTAALNKVLKFMYTGHIRLSAEDVEETLLLADYLCMDEVKCFCSEVLSRYLNPANCIHTKSLVDQFSLEGIRDVVTEFLTSQMETVLESPGFLEAPYEEVFGILGDPRLALVRERKVLESLMLWVEHDANERRRHLQSFLEIIKFDYLSPTYIKTLTASQYIMETVSSEQRKVIELKLSQISYPNVIDDIVVCRSRASMRSREEVALYIYVIREDTWYAVHNQPEVHLLDDLESLVSHQGSLYLLLTRTEDLRGYAHGPLHTKEVWKLELERGSWQRMPSPENLSGHSRLIPHVRGLYVIDRTGVVEKFDNMTGRWVRYSEPGFRGCPNATLYLLPMPMDKYIYVLRGYSEGYAFDFARMSYSLHRYDTARYMWQDLGEVDTDELDISEGERFHGYTATTTSLVLKTALGFPRLVYDMVTGNFSSVTPETNPPKVVSEIWGSAAHSDKVYFSGRLSANDTSFFMMYDHGRGRFKKVAPPPVSLSGLMCHVTAPRSFREWVVKCEES